MTRRDRIVVAVAVPFMAAVVTFVIGPTFIRPLPMSIQIGLAVAGAVLIAVIAVYSRRRASRSARRT